MFDPMKGKRLGPAWLDLMERLNRAQWSSLPELVRPVAVAHGLAEKTITNLIADGVKAGKIERRTVSVKPNRYEFRLPEGDRS